MAAPSVAPATQRSTTCMDMSGRATLDPTYVWLLRMGGTSRGGMAISFVGWVKGHSARDPTIHDVPETSGFATLDLTYGP
jgi:hypothetical protein